MQVSTRAAIAILASDCKHFAAAGTKHNWLLVPSSTSHHDASSLSSTAWKHHPCVVKTCWSTLSCRRTAEGPEQGINAEDDNSFDANLRTAYTAINSCNGYSRLFTIALTTCATLLVFAIVYQPDLTFSSARNLDYYYFDHVLSPSRTDDSVGRVAIPVALLYYIKVHG